MKPIIVYEITSPLGRAVCLDTGSALDVATRLMKEAKPQDRSTGLEKIKTWLSVPRRVGARTTVGCGTFDIEIEKRFRDGK